LYWNSGLFTFIFLILYGCSNTNTYVSSSVSYFRTLIFHKVVNKIIRRYRKESERYRDKDESSIKRLLNSTNILNFNPFFPMNSITFPRRRTNTDERKKAADYRSSSSSIQQSGPNIKREIIIRSCTRIIGPDW